MPLLRSQACITKLNNVDQHLLSNLMLLNLMNKRFIAMFTPYIWWSFVPFDPKSMIIAVV